MDRFKFRAWDTKRNIMLHDVSVNNRMAVEDGYQFYNQPTNGRLLVLMQCTGLKDRHGKLVFEGDVIQLGHYIFGLYSSRVDFIAGCFQQYPINQSGINSGILNYVHHTCEIIGNIYENPELIA